MVCLECCWMDHMGIRWAVATRSSGTPKGIGSSGYVRYKHVKMSSVSRWFTCNSVELGGGTCGRTFGDLRLTCRALAWVSLQGLHGVRYAISTLRDTSLRLYECYCRWPRCLGGLRRGFCVNRVRGQPGNMMVPRPMWPYTDILMHPWWLEL